MKIRCIKVLAAHWAIFFEVGKWYMVEDDKLEELEIITDYDGYILSLKQITSMIPDLVSYESGEIPQSLLDKQKELLKLSSQFLKKVKLGRYYIRGDDGTVHHFLKPSRVELIQTYGSDKFSTSKYFFDDYFETINKVRQDKIDKII